MATGCVKIVKRAKEFDPSTGKFIPEEKRAKSVDLFKGRWIEDYFDFVFITFGIHKRRCGFSLNLIGLYQTLGVLF